jgi:hypothetical protein
MHKVSLSSSPKLSVSSADQLADVPSPTAVRMARARWRDTRFWVGVLIVVTSIVLGSRLLAAADRTVEVWQLTDGQRSGTRLDPASVAAVRVHFDDAESESRYLLADQALPNPAVLTRDVGPGELLAVDAVSIGATSDEFQLPLLVPATGFPSNVSVGDRVEVWATPADPSQAGQASRVLADVAVIALSSADFATTTSDRSVVVAMPADADVKQVLDEISGRSVVLLRVGE